MLKSIFVAVVSALVVAAIDVATREAPVVVTVISVSVTVSEPVCVSAATCPVGDLGCAMLEK